jgi:hypothetical protein
MEINIEAFFNKQIHAWATARRNYVLLMNVRSKSVQVGNAEYHVQYNPGRIRSSAAKVDAKSISERLCFLCGANRPKAQKAVPFHTNGHDYEILINPYPIFQRHLTIPAIDHTPQVLIGRMADMLALAKALPDFTLFYNGAKCGASAPDHMHFQAGSRGMMPIEWQQPEFPNALFIQDADEQVVLNRFDEIVATLPKGAEEAEPMMNVLCLYEGSRYTVYLFPRKKHRPDCYYAEGEKQLLSSPASVDLGGLFILPRAEDFDNITAENIQEIVDEVCLYPDSSNIK